MFYKHFWKYPFFADGKQSTKEQCLKDKEYEFLSISIYLIYLSLS